MISVRNTIMAGWPMTALPNQTAKYPIWEKGDVLPNFAIVFPAEIDPSIN